MSSVESDSRPRLVTRRLSLRPFQLADSVAAANLLNDREVAGRCRSIDYPYAPLDARAWIDSHPGLWLEGRSVIFAICRRSEFSDTVISREPAEADGGESGCCSSDADEVLIGAVGLEINEADQLAELGYWLGRDFWNQGYATEAVQAVLAYGFETLALHRIFAQHMVRNPASGRVLVKAGLQLEGLLREHVRKWGVWEDVKTYGVLAKDIKR